MAKRTLYILIEGLLIAVTIGIIIATWLPIDRFRAWLQNVF